MSADPQKHGLQFLERRVLKQKGDLPMENEIDRLMRRAEGLRANLFHWPKDSPVWYVPKELIEECGLPAMMQLKQGEKPGDLLEEAFHTADRMKRRREELKIRIAQSEKAFQDFAKLLISCGEEIESAYKIYKETRPVGSVGPKQDWSLALAKLHPPSSARLCTELDVIWSEGQNIRQTESDEKTARKPFRTFRASTGEFIRVSKSAADADAMIKLMPSHHHWLHILTGEGSHVWLEKPKGAQASAQAVQEAGILAVHYSKHTKGRAGEVRLAMRADVEKKKDLAPGKVIVRRCDTMMIRYDDLELQTIIAGGQ